MGKALNLKQCGGHLIVAHRLRCLLKRFGRCAVTTFSIAQFDEFIDILGIFCICRKFWTNDVVGKRLLR